MKKEKILELVRRGEKEEIRNLFLNDHPSTIFFLQILEEIGSGSLTPDRKLRKKLPYLVPIFRKVIEAPMENLLNLCQTFYSTFQGKPISLPLSLFGGYWLPTSKSKEEDLKKLFLLIRNLVTYAIIKIRSDEEKEQSKAQNILNFVSLFLLSLDEEKVIPSWRLFLEHLHLPEFSEILRQLFFTFACFEKPIKICFPLQMPPFPERLKEDSESYKWYLFVPDEKRPVVKDLYEETKSKIEEENQRLMDFLREISVEEIKSEILQLWQKIQDPLYGLRPGGKDRVKLSIPEITGFSSFYQISSLQFFLEKWGEEGPVVKVKVNISFFEREYSYFFTLQPRMTQIQGRIYLPEDPRQIIDLILIYLATFSLKKIVTGELYKEKKETKKRGREKTPYQTSVRPHFRKLPVNWQASEEARLRARDILRQELPPGKTFVRDYKKGVGEELDGPLFTLTANDLKI